MRRTIAHIRRLLSLRPLLIALALALVCPLGCSIGTQQTAQERPSADGGAPGRTPGRIALDIAGCAVRAGTGSGLANWLGSMIDQDPAWRSKLLSGLATDLGPALACGLAQLATAQGQDAPAVPGEVGDLLYRRAGSCPGGTCGDPRLRAAWLLWQLSRRPADREPAQELIQAPSVRLPPSGEG